MDLSSQPLERVYTHRDGCSSRSTALFVRNVTMLERAAAWAHLEVAVGRHRL